jgi:signal transduction histidine kinase
MEERRGVKQVEFSISDTGPGIPIEVQEEVFKPFFTTKQDSGGRGNDHET